VNSIDVERAFEGDGDCEIVVDMRDFELRLTGPAPQSS
jgi:hypothetical protein